MAGEVLNTYIIVEQGDKVLFIDKHAAHERLNFDRMKAEGYQPMVQALLEPVVFTPPAEEGAAVQLGEEQILLTGFQERLWLAADGRHTLGAILKGMNLSWRSESPEQQELLMENILGLASSELCYFR